MRIEGAVALVTGAAGGIGAALVDALNDGRAKRIYAADLQARLDESPATRDPEVVPFALDVTDEAAVRRAADELGDVTLLINNAAILAFEGLIGASDLARARAMLEVNLWGYLHTCRAFAPVLARHGGGAIVNVLSEAARANAPFVGAYSVSKAAAWSLTQGVRAELAAQGTHVLAAFPSSTDTAMLAGMEGDKQPAEQVARGIVEALEQGLEDVSIGDHAVHFEALTPKEAEREFATLLPGVVAVPE